MEFLTHRPTVYARQGMVATSQPLAAQAGLDILKQGGSAADAAVATAAVLNVVEPMSTGIGGDMFALIYEPTSGQLRALNGSGRSGAGMTLEKIKASGLESIPSHHGLAVSVPGAVDGWLTLLEQYGRLPLNNVLAPAIYYAEHGFPVSPRIAASWHRAEDKLRQNPSAEQTYLSQGHAPHVGQIFTQPDIARTFKSIAQQGRAAFYEGVIAEKIAHTVQEHGGYLTLDDLTAHHSDWDEPLSMAYQGHRLVECPPNGQGLIALQALGILDDLNLAQYNFGQADLLHYQIEAIKLGFADAYRYVADPRAVDLPLSELLSPNYLRQRRELINPKQASPGFSYGNPFTQAAHSDTVYLSVVDGRPNGLAVSFINSLFHGFGSGIVVPGTGICLQDRASLFSLEPGHPNVVAPNKRPYHTIIPALLFKGADLRLCFGVMGGFMQPQGHLQVTCNMVDFGMDAQTALDAPRFRWESGNTVYVEAGRFDSAVLAELRKRGHTMLETDELSSFGGGQVIDLHPETGVLAGGTEPRKDGAVVGF